MAKDEKKSFGILQLTLMTYFLVCAGPYGVEEAVTGTGPLLALVAIVVIPIILSFPLSMFCAEMGSIFPQTGSTIMWALDIVHGLEKFLSAPIPKLISPQQQQLYDKNVKSSKRALITAKIITRIYSNSLAMKALVDNAMYPTMFCDYVATVLPQLEEFWWRVLVAFVSFGGIVWLNFYGLDIMGWAQYVFAVLVLAPMIVFIFMSFPDWDFSKISWENRPQGDKFQPGLLISNLIWLSTGFDQSTNLGDEVTNPMRTLPISLTLVVVLVIVSYFLPVIAGAMSEPDSENWYSGAFSEISLKMKGCENGWLKYWIIFSSAISALSIQNACVACTSRELFSNTQCGLLPLCKWIAKLKSFKKKKQSDPNSSTSSVQTDTANNSLNESFDVLDEQEMEEHGLVPWVAIIVVSVVPIALMGFDWSTLVVLDGVVSVVALFMQLLFYIYARHGRFGHYSRHPPKGTTFHLNSSLWMTVAVVTTPMGVAVFLCCTQGWSPIIIFLVVEVVMFCAWGIEVLIQRCKNKGRSVEHREDLVDRSTVGLVDKVMKRKQADDEGSGELFGDDIRPAILIEK